MTTTEDNATHTHPNGSETVVIGPWNVMTKVRNCPVYLGAYGHKVGTRTVQITGEPDTFFSIPARCSIAGRKVSGFVTSSNGADPDRPEGLEFIIESKHHEFVRLATEEHNGHRNWFAWNVSLWMFNDTAALADAVYEQIHASDNLSDATDRVLTLLRSWHGSKTPDGAPYTYAYVREAIEDDYEDIKRNP